MVAEAKENRISEVAGPVMDDQPAIDILLHVLAGAKVGERIAEAARLAVAEHQRQAAQQIGSVVEAENSTK
jgi:hypothetical protein